MACADLPEKRHSSVLEIISLLQHPTKLGRNEGICLLKQQCDIDDCRDAFLDAVQLGIIELFCGTEVEPAWETKQGCLLALKAILEKLQVLGKDCSDKVKVDMKIKSISLLSDEEYFVRLAAGEFLGTLSASVEVGVVNELVGVIFQGLESQLSDESSRCNMDVPCYSNSQQKESVNSNETTSTDTQSWNVLESSHHMNAEEIKSLTHGWRHLNTYLKALEAIVCSLACKFRVLITEKLLLMVSVCQRHSSYNVREAAADFLLAVVLHTGLSDCKMIDRVEEELIVKMIYIALSDDTSQIRMTACRAVREFLQHSQPADVERYLLLNQSSLLSALCFNRYHVADGLRLLSQEIWEKFSLGRGKELVEDNLNCVIKYYMNQMKSVNHEIRNAGLHCINELVTKLDRSLMCEHIVSLLKAVETCLRDECWPVRESACNVSSAILKLYHCETKCVRDDIFTRYCELLADEWHLVRESAALAIGDITQLTDVLLCGGEKSIDYVLHYMTDRLDYCSLCLREFETSKRDKPTSVGSEQSVNTVDSFRGKAIGLYGQTFNIERVESLDLLDGCICLLSALASLPEPAAHLHNKPSTQSVSPQPSPAIPVTGESSKNASLTYQQPTSYEALPTSHLPSSSLTFSVNTQSDQSMGSSLNIQSEQSMVSLINTQSDQSMVSSVNTQADQLMVSSINSQTNQSVVSSVNSQSDHSMSLFLPTRQLTRGGVSGALPCRSAARNTLPENVERVAALLPKVVDISKSCSEDRHNLVLQIICIRLPSLFTNLGKLAMKRYIELFFESMFEAARSDNAHTSSIGKQCIGHMSGMMGHSVFRARIESYNSSYLKYIPEVGSL